MLTYAAVLLLAPLVAGQVEKSTKPNDLAKLKAFMGNWEATDIRSRGDNSEPLRPGSPFWTGGSLNIGSCSAIHRMNRASGCS